MAVMLVATVGLEPSFVAGLRGAGRGRFAFVPFEDSDDSSAFDIGLVSDSVVDLADLTTRLSPRPVVVLAHRRGSGNRARLLVDGAVGVVDADGSPQAILGVIEHAVGGTALVPVEVLRAITGQVSYPPKGLLSDSEVRVLGLLARGLTIDVVATRIGYTTRSLSRLLSPLYEKMRVRGLAEARLRAIEWRLHECADESGDVGR